MAPAHVSPNPERPRACERYALVLADNRPLLALGLAPGTHANKLVELHLVVAAVVDRTNEGVDGFRRMLHLERLEDQVQLRRGDVAIPVEVELGEVAVQLLPVRRHTTGATPSEKSVHAVVPKTKGGPSERCGHTVAPSYLRPHSPEFG